MEVPLWLFLLIIFIGVFMLGAFLEHIFHARRKGFKRGRGLYPDESPKSNVRRSDDYDLECQRCHDLTNILYKHYRAIDESTDDWYENGQPIPELLREDFWLCWNCDWEVTNGYPMEMDIGELMMDRKERAYEEDPVNNPPPWL